MFYDRQVKYFDDFINGEKRGNRGFVKIEVRDCFCHVNLSVKGLEKEDCGEIAVYLETADGEFLFCNMEVRNGCGTKQLLNLHAENIGNTKVAYRELEAVKIPLSTERELCAVLEKKSGQVGYREKVVAMPELKAASKQIEEKRVWKEVAQEEPVQEEPVQKELVQEELVQEELVQKELVQKELVQEELVQEEVVQEEVVQEQTAKDGTEKKTMSLQDTKWKQLWEIYPRINPFQDERKYLSVTPGDFVILPEKYFGMANNSFLLHGYYNYHHLVLKKWEHMGRITYYIGVPGNYYDREKQVAVMFGFESFEGMQEPANAGDFGYYLMRIEL